MIRHHLAEDTIDAKDIQALIEWLKTSPRLTKDRQTLEFEKKWSERTGRRYSVFCNSGSSANLLMVYALLLSGKAKNKKVIVPSAGWVTTIAPAIQFGLEPIMCEADQETFGLELSFLESLLKKHSPAAVMMVQVLGVPHKMDALLKLKEKYGFILLEDSCASLGSVRHGKKVGTFGDMASFSFYFGHQMSTIEGGMVSTGDPQFRDLLLMSRSHGWSKDLEPAGHEVLVERYEIDDLHKPFVFYEPGFNLRSTDLNAFLGLRQIEKLDWTAGRRHENHMHYKKRLGEKFRIQRWQDPDGLISSISFCAIAESPEQRKAIATALTENGIETRLYTAGNLGLHPFWSNRYGKAHFTIADQLYGCGFFLPNHPSLNQEDVEFISQVVLERACLTKS